jgi:hypothetical protein
VDDRARGFLTWLTVERALYGACLAAAAALRLPDLGADPLHRREAAIAWPAWTDATTGASVPPAAEAPTSALLFSLDWLVFWVAGGGSDAMARWPAAVIGTGLVMLPWALRPVLGRTSALVATGILAIDPLLVGFSRRVDGAVVSAFCALLAVVGFARQASRGPARLGQRRRLFEAFPAMALGLLLISGTEAWSFALVLAVVVVASNEVAKPAANRGLGLAARGTGDPAARPLCIALATAMVAATTGLAQWEGPLAVSASLTAWIGNWQGPGDWGAALADLIASLATGQPLLLTLPLVGLVFTLPTRDRTSFGRARVVLLALLSATVLAIGQAGSVASRLPLVLALALVAGWAGGSLAVRIAALLRSGGMRGTVLGCSGVLGMGLLALVTIRGAVLGSPHAPPGIRLLVRDVAALCAGRAEVEACRIDVVAAPWPDPLLAWHLRDLAAVRWVLSPLFPRDGRAPPFLITPADPGGGEGGAALVGMPDRYAGGRYQIDGTAGGDGAIVLWVPPQ